MVYPITQPSRHLKKTYFSWDENVWGENSRFRGNTKQSNIQNPGLDNILRISNIQVKIIFYKYPIYRLR